MPARVPAPTPDLLTYPPADSRISRACREGADPNLSGFGAEGSRFLTGRQFGRLRAVFGEMTAVGRRGMGMKSNEVTRAVMGGAIDVHRTSFPISMSACS
jgi:hypothetical protein